MDNFDFLSVERLDEACALLDRYGNAAQVLAGGTDLIPEMKEKIRRPKYVINIKPIKSLTDIRVDGAGALRIGALVKVADIENSALLQDKREYQALVSAARNLGSVQVRNLATIGGNICHATPSAEFGPPLLALGAKALIAGPEGERSVRMDEFFVGPGITTLQRGEVLKEIVVPRLPQGSRSTYLLVAPRVAMDLAVVNVSICLCREVDGVVSSIEIALGAVAPTPLRAKGASALLRGKKVNEPLSAEAAAVASEECAPITDFRASAEYRRDMVKVLVKKGIVELIR